MGNMFIGLTDYDWYLNLKSKNYDEVNFWRPGKIPFRALNPNDLFLFKLKKPYYAIVGGGFFVQYSWLPISIVWEAFERKNGTKNYAEFIERLRKYREKNRIDISNPYVGCIVLTEPFFFERDEWIRQPDDWPASVVVGMNMDTEAGEGKRLFQEVCERLQRNSLTGQSVLNDTVEQSNTAFLSDTAGSYQYSLTRHRLGQGAFRVLVTETYQRQCAISGEKTLPVLDAAHIKPFSENGPHHIQNGILLRSDIHRLFDEGYMTIAPDFRVEVSRRLKEDFNNGRIYYQYHGRKLCVLPNNNERLPAKDFLSWHNENIYLG